MYSKIATAILSSPHHFTLKNGHLTYRNNRVKTCQVLLEAVPEAAKEMLFEHYASAMITSPQVVIEGLTVALYPTLALQSAPKEFVFQGTAIRPEDVFLFQNVEDESRSVVQIRPADIPFAQSAEDVLKRIKAVLGKDIASWQETNHKDCFLEYMPEGEPLVPGPSNIFKYNMWKKAPWVPEGTLPKFTKPPEKIAEYLSWLVPEKGELKSLLEWTRDCTFSRAGSVLILAGGQGVGKSFFAETILKNLVGEHNRKKAQTSWTKSNFQSSVKGCRLFIFEEKEINHEARELLKYYHDDKAVFDEKFQRVTGTPEKLHCSIVVCNNKLGSLKLSFADRKFFVPGLNRGSQKLDEAFGSKWVQELQDLSDHSPEWNLQLASYLFYKFPEGASKVIPKTALFKEIAIRAMSRQARTFYDMCLRYPTFTARDLYKVVGRQSRLTLGDLESLLEDYYADFREPLAEILVGSHLDKWEVKSLIHKPTNSSVIGEK